MDRRKFFVCVADETAPSRQCEQSKRGKMLSIYGPLLFFPFYSVQYKQWTIVGIKLHQSDVCAAQRDNKLRAPFFFVMNISGPVSLLMARFD